MTKGLILIARKLGVSTSHLCFLLKIGILEIPREEIKQRIYFVSEEDISGYLQKIQEYKRDGRGKKRI